MRDIVKGMSNKGFRYHKMAVNGGGVRERDRQTERWLGYILLGLLFTPTNHKINPM